jgi:S1-C subfamily serine protease
MRWLNGLLVLLLALVRVHELEAREVNSKNALQLLSACRQPTDAYDTVCVDRWLKTCARAREAGLSAELDAEAALQMGIIWAGTIGRGCSCCEQAFLYQGNGPKNMSMLCFREALTVKPDYTPARARVVWRLVDDGNNIEALANANEGVRLAPQDSAAHALIGYVNVFLKRWRQASDAYSTAARLSTKAAERAEHLEQSAELGFLAGDDAVKLIPVYQEAARLKPNWAKPHAEAGWLLTMIGKTDEAKREFEEALRIQPGYFNAAKANDPVKKAYETVVLGIGPAPKRRESEPRFATGSGFFVTRGGLFVTNHHVVDGAKRVGVRVGEKGLPAKIVRVDSSNDLAVLRVMDLDDQSNEVPGKFEALPIAMAGGLRLGASVVTVGFPNPDMQGVEPKLTRGEISSLAGIQDDPRHFQISAPIQPGNSGGPLVDVRGNVIGVVVARLGDAATFKATGMLPQNVNYAVKSSYLTALLESIPGASEGLLPAGATTRNTEQLGVVLTRATGLVMVELASQ